MLVKEVKEGEMIEWGMENLSQSSLAHLSTSSESLMSWMEVGSEGRIRCDDDTSLISQPRKSKETSDSKGDYADKVDTFIPTTWPLDLPLDHSSIMSLFHVKRAELEARMSTLLAQFMEHRVNLSMFLVSNVLLFTVGVFIGRRSSPKIL
jgi:hypothetical protein